MLDKYCSMCGGYYHDGAKHRHVDCPYYHGCICGKKPANQAHVDGCFLVKESKRKKASEKKEKPMFPITSHLGDLIVPSYTTCSMCLQRHNLSTLEHRSHHCQYYLGCKSCGRKYFEPTHLERCGTINPSARTTLCLLCSEWIESTVYEEHRKKCGTVVATLSKDRIECPDYVACGLCGERLHPNHLDAHIERCKERILSKFKEPSLVESVIKVIDHRRQKGDRVVQFKEAL